MAFTELWNKCGIYKILNKKARRCYIGSSVNIGRRLTTHQYMLRKGTHGNLRLQNAWNKYGEESFSFAVVEFCDQSILLEREQFFLDLFNSCSNGYNISPLSVLAGVPAHDDVRIKQSEAHKKSWEDPEVRAKRMEGIKKAMTGRTHTEETKEKMRLAVSKAPLSEETREKIRQANLGRKMSQEAIKKRTETRKLRKLERESNGS